MWEVSLPHLVLAALWLLYVGNFFLRKRKQLKQKERVYECVWCGVVCVRQKQRQKQTLQMKTNNITE